MIGLFCDLCRNFSRLLGSDDFEKLRTLGRGFGAKRHLHVNLVLKEEVDARIYSRRGLLYLLRVIVSQSLIRIIRFLRQLPRVPMFLCNLCRS